MAPLDGTVAVITGAAGALGAAIAERFVAEGANVCLADVSERVEEVADRLGDAAIPVVTDVSTWTGNNKMVRRTTDTFGRLDTLVCNAAVYDQRVALVDIPGERLAAAFDELFHVNVLGYLLGIRAALDPLRKSRGSVVATVSYAGFYPAGGGSLYTGSKHAVVGLIRQLAHELAPHVRVNGVSPGVLPSRLRGLQTLGQKPADSILPSTIDALPTRVVPEAGTFGALYVLAAGRETAPVLTGTVLTAHSGLDIRGVASPDERTSVVSERTQ